MRLSTAGLIASIFTLAAAACGRSVTDPLAANRRDGRDLGVSAGQASPAVFASAMELNRVETQLASEAKPMVHPPRPAPKSPQAEEAPAPPPPVAEPTLADVEVKPVPTPDPAPAMVVVPVSTTSTFTAAVPGPVASGTAVALEPGQSILVLTSPIAGATAQDNNTEMPAITHEGAGMGGGACPHGGRGRGIGFGGTGPTFVNR